jgi:two-component system, cell cycle sensor histidine kinase and response regulator CckA
MSEQFFPVFEDAASSAGDLPHHCELRLDGILERLPIAAFVRDASGLITYFNETAAKLWGRTPRHDDSAERFFGSFKILSTDGESVAPDRGPTIVAPFHDRAEHGELLVERPDGRRIQILISGSPLVDRSGVGRGTIVFHIDMTERQRAEEALRESERRFSQFMEHLPGLAWIKDAQGRYVYATNATAEAFRTPKEGLYGRTDDDIFPPETAAQFKANDAEALKSPNGVRTVEMLRDETATLRQSIVSKFPLPDPSGGAALVGGIAVDVTDLHQAQQALRKLSDFRESVIRTMAEGICVCFAVPEFPYVRFSVWNERMTELTGYTMDEINRLGWYQTMYPDPEAREQAIHRISRMRAGADLHDEEWTITRKDGEPRIVAISTSIVELEEGGEGVVALMQDVTERRRAAEAQQRRLVDLTVLSRIGVICSEAETEDDVLHRATEVVAGNLFPDNCGFLLLDPSRGVLITHPSFVLSDPMVCRADKPLGTGITGQVALTGKARRVGDVRQEPGYLAADSRTCSELCLPMKIGSKVVGVFNAESDKPDAFSATDEQLLGTVVDLVGNTLERLRAEKALRESETRLRTMLETQPECVKLLSADGTVLEMNAAGLSIIDADSSDQVIGKCVVPIVVPEHRAAFREVNEQVFLGRPGHLEFEITSLKGVRRWLEMRATPLRDATGNIVAAFSVTRDFTRQRQADEELREKEYLLSQSQRIARIGSWQHDLVTHCATFSDETYRLYGVSRESFVPSAEAVIGLVHPDDRAALREQIRLAIAGEMPDPLEFRVPLSDGSTRILSGRAELIRDAMGQPTRLIGTVQDISERKRAERALAESEEKYRNLVDEMSDGVFVVDTWGALTFSNPALARILGFERIEDLLGRRLFEFLATSSLIEVRKSFQETLESGQAPESVVVEVDRPDGKSAVVEVRPRVVMADHRVVAMKGVIRDITERRRAEEERRQFEVRLMHAQKLESLGLLAGGIAHDFNNLLTAMLGYGSLARNLLPPESSAIPMLRELENAAERAAELTHQMLAYAGKGRFVVQPLPLNALARELTRLLATVVSGKAEFELDLRPATIDGDATQIRQVIMNLITNASDALLDGKGTIHVRTGVRHLDHDSLHSPFIPDELPPGDYAYIEVEDTGCGMSDETVTRVFDPFFTTKFTGRGLGMAATLGIVRSHRGTIKVKSIPGQGTLFQVYLPSAAATSTGKIDAAPEGSPPRGHGMVLVIDDEPGVRDFTRGVLERAGFRVVVAEDGQEGLDVYLQHRREIVAVLLDLTMPRWGGVEFLRQMRPLAPDVPVIVMSGHSEKDVSYRIDGAGASGFVQKPFQPRDLVERLCRMLSSRAENTPP